MMWLEKNEHLVLVDWTVFDIGVIDVDHVTIRQRKRKRCRFRRASARSFAWDNFSNNFFFF